LHPYFEKYLNNNISDLRLKSRDSQRIGLRSRENSNQLKNELFKKDDKILN